MATRPSASGPSTGSVTAGTVISISHTSETGKAIYVVIGGQNNNFNNLLDACTFNAAPLTKRGQWAVTHFGFSSAFVFTLPPVVAGMTATLTFTAVDSSNYSLIAFNVADGAPDADIILYGGFFRDAIVSSFTRRAYAWDPDGLQVAFLWAGLATTPTLTGGTQLAAGTGTKLNTIAATDSEISFTASRVGSGHLSLSSFLIPANHPRTGDNFQPWICGQTSLSSLAAGASVEVGLPYGGASSGGGQGNLILFPGTLRSWAMKSSVPPGTNGTITAEIIRGGRSDSTATIGTTAMFPTGVVVPPISGAVATESTVDGLTFGWSRYERLSIRYTNTGSAALPSGITVTSSFLVESAVMGEQLYGGGGMDFGSTNVDEFAYRAPLHPDVGTNWSVSGLDDKALVGISNTVAELVANYQTESASVAIDHQYYLRKNNVLQDGTAGTVDTTASLVIDSLGAALARSRFSLAYVPGDLTAAAEVTRDATSALLRQAVTIRVVATTPGEIMLSGHSVAATGTADYVAQANSPRNQTTTTLANEVRLSNILPPMTAAGDDFHARGVIGLLETAGASPGTLDIELRKNEAATAMPDLTFSGATTTGQVSGDVPYAGGDTIGFLNDVTSAPTLTRQFWSIPGFSAPAAVGTITVVKDAGGDVVEVFDFTTVGLTPGTFSLSGGDSQLFDPVTAGTGYQVSEDPPPPGWQLDSVTVSNGSPSSNISVADGEDVIVTFVNSQVVACPGEVIGIRDDGQAYAPVAPGGVVTLDGEPITFDGDPVTFGACEGDGIVSGPRIGQ